MGETTAIEWTGPNGKTWSPWFGCTKVHAGCKHCYAEADNARYNRNGDHRAKVAASWGPGAPRKPRAEAGWKLPLEWAADAAKAGERWKVFPSLCDPLDEEAPPATQARFWELIKRTAVTGCHTGHPAHPPTREKPGGRPEWIQYPETLRRYYSGLDWLLLTKRPERWQLIPEDVRPLVWLLTSVSDQPTADEYVPRLLEARGFALLGVSVEPLIGPVELRDALGVMKVASMALNASTGDVSRPKVRWERSYNVHTREPIAPQVGWVIGGGESGGSRRPSEVQWYADLAVQCDVAGVPFFMKQDTALYPGEQGRIPDELWKVKQFPEVIHAAA